MKCSEWKAPGLALLWMSISVLAHGQVQGVGRASVSAAREQATLNRSPAEELIRQIDDPHTGDRWLLMRDRTHPGGPGRLVRVAAASDVSGTNATAPRQSSPPEPQQLPVIHRGDHLVLEESTSRIHARFEVVALGAAFAGSPLRVRMVLGGKVVRAVALEPGRVAFAPQTEVVP